MSGGRSSSWTRGVAHRGRPSRGSEPEVRRMSNRTEASVGESCKDRGTRLELLSRGGRRSCWPSGRQRPRRGRARRACPWAGRRTCPPSSLRLSSSRMLTPTLRRSSSVRSRASQSDFSQRRVRSSPGSAASQARWPHAVEAAQERVGHRPPARAARARGSPPGSPSLGRSARPTSGQASAGSVNKNIQWQVRPNERGQGSPRATASRSCSSWPMLRSLPARHPPAEDQRSSETPEPRGCVESHGRRA